MVVDGRKALKNRLGFTLVELMIAITMLGILLAAAMPSFNSMVGDNRINAEANKFIANLNYSRVAASTRATVINLSRKSATSKDWTQGWEIYTDQDAAGNTSRTVSDTLLRDVGPLDAGVSVNANTSGNAWISFNTNGMLNENGNTVVIAFCDERGEASGRDITISFTGRVRISAPSLDCTP